MHPSHQPICYRSLVAGSCASVFSAIALAWFGRREAQSAAAPINAVSHWYWDDPALKVQQTDVSHTLLGYVTHHGASIFWATLLCAYLRRQPQTETRGRLLAASMATSAIACVVDFKFTPRRLTPGYEHRLSKRALAVTYLVFGAGLAVGLVATSLRRTGQRGRSKA